MSLTNVPVTELDRIRRACALLDGWVFNPAYSNGNYTVPSKWHRGDEVSTDPCPAALDGVSKLTPKGWEIRGIEFIRHDDCGCHSAPTWQTWAWQPAHPNRGWSHEARVDATGETELLARYRLLHAMLKVSGRAAGSHLDNLSSAEIRELKNRPMTHKDVLAIMDYIEWFGAIHDKGCPEDDTCDCSGKPRNEALNIACARMHHTLGTLKEVEFWKRMALRGSCKCLRADCGLHGSYSPEDLRRLEVAEDEFVKLENERLAKIGSDVQWAKKADGGVTINHY